MRLTLIDSDVQIVVECMQRRRVVNDARMTQVIMDELPERVREMVGVIPAGEDDSVEEYHRHLVEEYDSVE